MTLAGWPKEVRTSLPALPGWLSPCLALGPCFHWLPIPRAEKEPRWAGRRAWIAHLFGNFVLRSTEIQETKALLSSAISFFFFSFSFFLGGYLWRPRGVTARRGAGGRSRGQGVPSAVGRCPKHLCLTPPTTVWLHTSSFGFGVKCERFLARDVGIFPSLQQPCDGLWETALGNKWGFSLLFSFLCLLKDLPNSSSLREPNSLKKQEFWLWQFRGDLGLRDNR